MSAGRPPALFLCNGASLPIGLESSSSTSIDYRPPVGKANVQLGLPAFVRSVYHLPGPVPRPAGDRRVRVCR